MKHSLVYAPLRHEDLSELAVALRHELVYQHIGGVPSEDDFLRGHEIAIAGPPPERGLEKWLNFVVRLSNTGELVGRLEATVHDGFAEVAFVFSPSHWGQGYATQGVRWLHEYLRDFTQVRTLWAACTPENSKSASLLQRCDYIQVSTPPNLPLYTYDEGDFLFTQNI